VAVAQLRSPGSGSAPETLTPITCWGIGRLTHEMRPIRCARVPFAIAVTAFAALTLAVPARADNDDAFIQAITADGISIDRDDAISQAHAVCLLLEQSAGAPTPNAVQQVMEMHVSWSAESATHFVDSSIQYFCPDKALLPISGPGLSSSGPDATSDPANSSGPTPSPAPAGSDGSECPPGDYQASSGDCVPDPKKGHADRSPTAICQDGDYSYSEHPNSGGTCHGHGGVAKVLAP
jgi:hypothetical protein